MTNNKKMCQILIFSWNFCCLNTCVFVICASVVGDLNSWKTDSKYFHTIRDSTDCIHVIFFAFVFAFVLLNGKHFNVYALICNKNNTFVILFLFFNVFLPLLYFISWMNRWRRKKHETNIDRYIVCWKRMKRNRSR